MRSSTAKCGDAHGRQQFLIDHPWYVEAGEALPVHKEPPKAGGDFPIRLTGGHTRWSIHALSRYR
jgi:nitrate reductase alpha subunit